MDKREYLSRYHEAEKKIKKLQAFDEYDACHLMFLDAI